MKNDPSDHATNMAVIDALIALAARDGLGDDVPWDEVELAISQLLEAPVSMSNLRRRMEKVNDAEVALTLHDWFVLAADAREKDARDAARSSDKVLAPLQGVGYGSAVTAALFAGTGALGLVAGVAVAVSALVFAIGATMGRLRLSGREDAANDDVRAIRRMAKILRERGDAG